MADKNSESEEIQDATDYRKIKECLEEATKHSLQVEVVHLAMLELKNNPSMSISDAMSYGFNEWVK